MGILNTPEANAKNASLKLDLKTNTGFRSQTGYPAISANQWADILAVCGGGRRYRVMDAAPDLLSAAQKALNFIENTEGEMGERLSCGDALRAAIARALDTAPQAEGVERG